jgi:hypothetical protein
VAIADRKKRNDDWESGDVCAPRLFVRDNIGQVLQHRVRGYGKDVVHRLFVRTCRLQGQNLLNATIIVLGLGTASASYAQIK